MSDFPNDIGRLTPHLRRFARALVRGHAEAAADDLVQQAILLALRAAGPRTGSSLAVCCFAGIIRLNRLRNRASIDPVQGHTDRAPLPFLPKDIVRLDVLPLDAREALLLTTVAGLGYEQAAAVLQIDLPVVFARLTQARDRLTRIAPVVGTATARTSDGARVAAAHLRLVK